MELSPMLNLKIEKKCKIIFLISVYFNDEIELDVFPLDVCEVVFRSPRMYMQDAIFMWKSNQYRLIKDGKSFTINAHKGK